MSFLVTYITISTQSQRSSYSMLSVLASFCVMQWSYFGCKTQPRVSKVTLHYYGQSHSSSSDVQQNMQTYVWQDVTEVSYLILSHTGFLNSLSVGIYDLHPEFAFTHSLKLKTVISGGKLCFTKGLKQPKWICLLVYYDNHSLWNKLKVTRGICAWSHVFVLLFSFIHIFECDLVCRCMRLCMGPS